MHACRGLTVDVLFDEVALGLQDVAYADVSLADVFTFTVVIVRLRHHCQLDPVRDQ